MMYRTVKNFGGEKTLAEKKLWRIWRIATIRQVFFANFYLVQCHVVWRSQPFMHPLNNERDASPFRMKAAAALHSLSITAWIRLFYIRDNHRYSFHSEPRTTTLR